MKEKLSYYQLKKNDRLVVVEFELIFGEEKELVQIGYTSTLLREVVADNLSQSQPLMANKMTQDDKEAFKRTIKTVPLTLKVLLGQVNLDFDDLNQIKVGDVLPLRQKISQPLNVLAENKIKFKAYPGQSDGHKSIKITDAIKNKLQNKLKKIMNDEELEKEDLTTDTDESTEQENVQDETENSDEIGSDDEESSPDENDSETERVEFHEFDSDQATEENAQNNINILKDVNVEVSVELGRITMPLGDVLNLSKGSVVELENLAGEQINVLVNGQKIAMGEVVVIGEHFGVRISKLISTKLKTN